jgi:pimeloyl-ACP methyl ester carboxylesterase
MLTREPEPAMTLAEWRAAGASFRFRGRRIFYAGEGQGRAGEALLLIHGFPTASWDWHRVWSRLADRFRLVAPDMLGFGFSEKPRDHVYAIAEQATLHEELLGLLAIDRVHVLAHDYGDTVAQELLARALEGSARVRVQSVCFLNGGLFPEAHRARRIQTLLAGPLGPLLSRLASERSFRRGFATIFGPRTKPSEPELHDFWQLLRHGGGHRIGHLLIRYMEERREQRERWVGALVDAKRKGGIPIRFVNGVEDPVSGGHMLTRYRAVVPEPDYVALDGIGHYPQVEDPEGVLRAFFDFARRNGFQLD